MKKYHIFGRFWIGFGVGVIIGDLITAMISLAGGSGELLFLPQLSALIDNHALVFLIQFLLFGLIGTIFAEAGILFVLERWNFCMTCLLHFAVTAVFYLPFLGICYFGQRFFPGILIVLGNILFTYFVTWLVSYVMMRSAVDLVNRKIEYMRKKQRDGRN